MRISATLGVVLVLSGIVSAAMWLATADAQKDKDPDPEKFRPKWQTGDKWVVETASKPLQMRFSAAPVKDKVGKAKEPEPVKVRWQFTVAKKEKREGVMCYRVNIACLKTRDIPDPEKQPTVTLWVNIKSMVVVGFQTRTPDRDGFTTLTETYQSDSKQPTPVIVGPLTALPLDMPLFLTGKARGDKFTYQAMSGPPGKRAADDVAFGVSIAQKVAAPSTRSLKNLPEAYSRDLKKQPVIEVELKTDDRRVRQLWQVGQPWPVFSSNGSTTARLLSYQPAKAKDRTESP